MTDADKPCPQGNVNDARINRYAKVDLAGITVRRVVTDADFAIVARLREQGLSRVAGSGSPVWVDDLDRTPGVFSLIAYNNLNEPVATMRMQDGRMSELELSRLVPLDTLLDPGDKPAVQIGRLSVIRTDRSTDAVFGIFKSSWLWCLRRGIGSMVIASPPWARHVHRFMYFEDIGPDGHFHHQFAGGALHITMKLSVTRAEEIWRSYKSPICEQIFDIDHPFLEFT